MRLGTRLSETTWSNLLDKGITRLRAKCITPLYEDHDLKDTSRPSTRYWYLSMRKLLILYSSVVLGTPSLLAAPSGPEIRPPVSARAASMSPRSWFIRDGCRPHGGS